MGQKKKWPSAKRLEIVLEGIRTGQVAETCRRHGCKATQYYDWQKALMSSADAIFDKRSKHEDAELMRLRSALSRKNDIIAEVIADNMELKKIVGD